MTTPPTDRPLTAGDDWIEWHGGENPVPGTWVEVSHRGRIMGFKIGWGTADNMRWTHNGSNEDIIAYRLARPATSAASDEGAGGWKPLDLERLERDLGYRIASSHFGGAVVDTGLLKECREVIAALRARTSEPAGEAVAWEHRIYGADAKPGPWEPSNGPSDGKTLRPCRIIEYRPAPATADKLRAVVEGFVSDLTGGHPNARRTRLVISHNALSARIDQALATLNEEGNA